MFLKGRGKIYEVIGPAPKASDPMFVAWDIEDSMLMSWLWSSMQLEVSKNYMFLSTAKDIWETIKRTYSKVQDASIVYEIKTKISSTKQGSMSMINYYNKMNCFWLQLDHYEDIEMVCSEDAIILTSMLERYRIVEFLAGLNPEFDQVRVQILSREKMPSLNEVYFIVRSEEHKRVAMFNDHHVEGSAMVSNRV